MTDCETGQPIYYEKSELGEDLLHVLRASASLPLISKPVKFRDRFLLYGGLSDSIPLEKCLADGNPKCVLILTQDKNYCKSPGRLTRLMCWQYPQFKQLHQALKTRHLRYNETLERINQLEREGRIFVIRPKEPLRVGQIRRNQSKLMLTYDQGYLDAQDVLPALQKYLSQ